MATAYPDFTTEKDELGSVSNGDTISVSHINDLRRRIERLEGTSDINIVDDEFTAWRIRPNDYVGSGNPATTDTVVPEFVCSISSGGAQASPYSPDSVQSFGWNVNANGTRLNTDAHSCAWRQEYMFNTSSNILWIETHFEVRTPSSIPASLSQSNIEDGMVQRTSWRPIAVVTDINPANAHGCQVDFSCTKVSINDSARNENNMFQFTENLMTMSHVVGNAIASGAATITGGAFGGVTTTMTASGSVFDSYMVGSTMVITGVGSFTIASYSSATQVTVTGDASAASSSAFYVKKRRGLRTVINTASLERTKVGDPSTLFLEFNCSTAINFPDAYWTFNNTIYCNGAGMRIGNATSHKIGFWGSAAIVQPTVSGSTGANAALQSLLTALDTMGLINDTTT